MPKTYFAIPIALFAISFGIRLMKPEEKSETGQLRNYYIFLDVASILIAFMAGFLLSAINW